MGSMGSVTPPGWAPREMYFAPLFPDESVVAQGRQTFTHINVITIPKVPEIIPPENKEKNMY